MTARVRRKFTILDGMILVAAIACGFAIHRAIPDMSGWGILGENWLGRNARDSIRAALPFLLMLTLGTLVMRLRRPRPRWRALARQPGTAACCATVVPIALHIGLYADQSRIRPGNDALMGYPWFWSLVESGAASAGLWVLAAWLAMAISGRRRPERSWIDRLGRIVGLGWLLLLAFSILAPRQ